LVSSENSKLPITATDAAVKAVKTHSQQPEPLPPRLHRSLLKMKFRATEVLAAAGLSLGLMFSAIYFLPMISDAWMAIFEIGIRQLNLNAQIELISYEPMEGFRLVVGYLRIQDGLVDPAIFWASALATALLFFATLFLSERFTPLLYLFRGILLVQTSALFFFGFFAARFAQDSSSFLAGLSDIGMAMIVLTPLFMGLTYYIFNFGILKKLILTLLIMAHLIIWVPVQLLLHSYILQRSILFMPVLYIFFGVALDVMIIISFYAWGMSWKLRFE
jgi:hypothetical protein